MPSRPKKKVKIQEGTWFAVPLKRGGWAIGLLTRVIRALVVAHFFGPRRRSRPTRQSIERLSRADTVWVGHTSELGIRLREWPVLFVDADFRRSDWPLVDLYLYESGGWFDQAPAVDKQEAALTYVPLHGHGSAAAELERRLSPRARRVKLPTLESLPPEPLPREQHKAKVEQAVLISFNGSNIDWLDAFVGRLGKLLKPNVGELDGHERGVGDGKLVFYGPNAARLWRAIEKTVRQEPALCGGKVTLRSGPPDGDSPEKVIALR